VEGAVTKPVNDFAAWLDAALSRPMPPDVRAFNFNLYEGVRGTWDIELIGAPTFDPGDPDWACDENFSYPELFFMRRDEVGDQWEQALAMAIDLVSTYLRGGNHRHVLRTALGVGVGFVDGELSILWPETAA
jgi:hypothetical protein